MTTKTHETLIPLAVTCGGVMATHPGTRGLVMMSEHDLERFRDRVADHIVDANKMVKSEGWKLVPAKPTPEWKEKLAEIGYSPSTVIASVLAAAPQQPAPQPLTVEAIRECIDEVDLDWERGWSLEDDDGNSVNRYLNLARAIERAHGIKEQP